MPQDTHSQPSADKKQDVVEVQRINLIYVRRAIDDAVAEIEAAVADGDVDESVLSALDESLHIIEGYLK